MKSTSPLFALTFFFCSLFSSLYASSANTIRIKLTGSIYENVQVLVGQTGRTEIISSLPYTLEVPKAQLPLTLHFQSPSYLYYDIDVPKKAYDTTGHVYLVKVNETAMTLRNSNTPRLSGLREGANDKLVLQDVATGIDICQGVNAAPITDIKNEKTFALIISNEEYEMADNVANATNDGLAFKEYCTKTLGLPGNNVRYCSNLSFGKMKKAISDILDLTNLLNGEANLILYYAGHGIPDNKTKDAYLMPTDADGTDTEICISLSDLYNRIEKTRLRHCIVFLDACFSGAKRDGAMIVAARGVKLKPKAITPIGKTVVFSATSEDETAFSYQSENHGLFTYFLLAKLQQTNGKVTLGELAKFVKEKVSLESRRINNNPQTPKISVSSGLADSWESISLIK